MKKLLALTGAFALALSLSACGGGSEEPTADQKTGLISTTEDVAMPEQETEEVAVDDADALAKKWEDAGEAYAASKGYSSYRVNATFQNFSSDKIESYKLYFNDNKDWKTGDKVKVDFTCQTVKPTTIKVWIVPDLEDVDIDDQKGQLTEVGCGVDTPATASWEYTVPADTNNLIFVQYQVPVEGFMILMDEKQ
ncbi:hypothetical protein [Mobiluncus sp.]|uniref:hypothetical protein n=1 Tax=Mobiluncus sp. TaxID=47293 RepID=UPI002A91F0EE|nr:hypothetical protein [Mobiluncus sp.]MDY6077311.1 hypothetical protein [Mobiluncus sp.]